MSKEEISSGLKTWVPVVFPVLVTLGFGIFTVVMWPWVTEVNDKLNRHEIYFAILNPDEARYTSKDALADIQIAKDGIRKERMEEFTIITRKLNQTIDAVTDLRISVERKADRK